MAASSGQVMLQVTGAETVAPLVSQQTRNKKDDNLYFRRCPIEFVKYIKMLNPRQIEAVKELGFGPILNYNVPQIPGMLAHWVLSVFDRPRCTIAFAQDNGLRLTEDDVHLTFGFPKGGTFIERTKKIQTNFVYNDDVARRLGKSRYMLTAGEIGSLMLQDVDGGPDFKKLFMFLLENALIETPSDGMLKPKILHYIDDVDEIRNFNWSNYLISVLDFTYKSWKVGTSVSFSGPISFLVSAYVDRVVYCRRRVIRAWPTVKGWTTDSFRERQDAELMEVGQFGSGSLEGRFDKDQYLLEEERIRIQRLTNGSRNSGRKNQATIIKDEFAAHSAHMAKSISDWVDYFKKIPTQLMDEGCLESEDKLQ